MKKKFFLLLFIISIFTACEGQFLVEGDLEILTLKVNQEEINSTSTKLNWETGFPTKGSVEYGLTTDLGESTSLSDEYSLTHTQNLGGLNKYTKYYYRIKSVSESGKVQLSSIKEFKTKPHDVNLDNAVLASSFGYDATNATAALKAAFSSPAEVIIVDKQDTDWLIEPTKHFSLKNKTIIFEEGVTLRSISGAFTASNATLLNFSLPENVKVYGYGATLAMNKSEYTTGEGRHSVTVTGADGFHLEGFTITGSGGDGFYVAGSVPPFPNFSNNVYVDNVVFDNHRRQGMSVISAQNVYVTNSTFKNTIGTLPGAGVDLEANRPEERLVNINFDNCRFLNNDHSGFLVAATYLDSTSLPVSVRVTNSYFSMNHSVDNAYSKGELGFGVNRSNPVTGLVEFENIEFDGSEWGLFKSRMTADGFQVRFKNIKAKNMLQSTENSGFIVLEVPSYFDDSSLGNFHFENVEVDYTADIPLIFVFDWSTLTEMKNITGSIGLKNPQNPPRLVYRLDPNIVENNVSLVLNRL